MSRKPSFANLRGAAPVAPVGPAPAATAGATPGAGQGNVASRPVSREGRKQIAGFFSHDMSLAMHMLARRESRSLQALMAEAFNDVLRKHGSVPRADPPGSRYRYNSLTAYTAGVVVAKATGRSMADFARTSLFRPLGIRRWQWAADAAGYTKGQGNLSLTVRDFATIGEMVRGEGLYRGRRIVSAGWIRDALAPKVSIADSDPYAEGYGYFWYSKVQQIDGRPVPVSFASGNGGNKIYVVPSRNMVVAITSSAYGHGYGQRRSEAILKAILSTDRP